MTSTPSPHPRLGLALGILAVALFGATLPVTRWTLSPELSPVFLTSARVVGAALVSGLYLMALRAAWPRAGHWRPLAVAALGNALLYPGALALALQSQSAGHVAVITALLPLVTALVAVVAVRAPDAPRGSRRFWACAVVSTAAVVWFSARRAGGGWQPSSDDLIVAVGVLAAALGYVQAAGVTRDLGATTVVAWVNLLALPLALPVAWASAPMAPLSSAAWWGLGWLSLVSMWAAMFVWYRALDWGGPLRVSQVQALQPFFSIALAWPILGERPEALTLAVAAVVVALVAWGTRRN